MNNQNSWGFFTQNQQSNLDIELLKKEIGQRFPFYDLKYNDNNAAFFCRIDENSLESFKKRIYPHA